MIDIYKIYKGYTNEDKDNFILTSVFVGLYMVTFLTHFIFTVMEMRAPEMRNKYNYVITLCIFILLVTRISTMVYLALNEHTNYLETH